MTSTVTDRLYGENSSVAIKAPVVAVSQGANVTLTGLQTFSGYTTQEGDRVLLKDQTDPTTNGIYNASAAAWTRTGDFDGTYDVTQGTLVVVYQSGGTNLLFQLTTANPIIGTTGLTFAEYSPIAQRYPQTQAEANLGITPADYTKPPYTIARYNGFDPSDVLDSTAALQAAINCAQEADYAMVRVGQPGAKLKIGLAWTIDTNKTGIDFEGAFIDASSFTTGNWCTIQQSASDVNQRPLLNAAHPIRNATYQGPGAQNTAAICVYFNDTNATPTIAGVLHQDIGFQDWGQDVYFNNGAFCNSFEDCTFAVTVAGSSTHGTNYSVTMANATNAGERNIFRQCAWYNKNYYVQNLSSSSDIYLEGCSMDGHIRALTCSGGGCIFFLGGHIESGNDTDNWVYASGQNSSISISKSMIVLDANKTLHDMCWSDSTCTNGGVFLDQIYCGFGPHTFSTRLIGGTGNAVARNLIQSNGSAHPTVASSLNMLAYGGFEQTAYANDWTFSGTTPPSRTNTQTHSGTYSLQFPGASGNAATAVATRRCAPGQYVQGELYYLAPAITGTAATFFGQLDYLDEAGTSLGTDPFFSITANAAAWVFQQFKFQTPAPAGTVNAKLTVGIFGATSGTPIGYIDDVILNVIE